MPAVRVGAIDLWYDTFGDPEAPPLVLIMGLACQMIVWDEGLCQALADGGHYVVRFDNRDVGRSSRLAAGGRPSIGRAILRAMAGLPVSAPYTLDDMADDTAGLIAALGFGHAHVLGASMGGMIAQALAIRHPGRVASLVSVMSSTGKRWLALPRYRGARALLCPRPVSAAAYVEDQVRLWRAIGSPAYPFPETAIRRRSERALRRGLSGAGIARQMVALVAARDRSPALRRLDLPTLVIHGDQDPMVPIAGGRATAAAIPGATLWELPGVGHDLPSAIWPELVARVTEVTRMGEARRAATSAAEAVAFNRTAT